MAWEPQLASAPLLLMWLPHLGTWDEPTGFLKMLPLGPLVGLVLARTCDSPGDHSGDCRAGFRVREPPAGLAWGSLMLAALTGTGLWP